MSTPTYLTFADLARSLNRDRRHPSLRQIPPNAFLRLGDRLIPIFTQGENGGRVSTKTNFQPTKE